MIFHSTGGGVLKRIPTITCITVIAVAVFLLTANAATIKVRQVTAQVLLRKTSSAPENPTACFIVQFRCFPATAYWIGSNVRLLRNHPCLINESF